MDCREVREMNQRLVEWMDGELQDEAVIEAVRAHVARCAKCAREVAEHRRTWEALATLDAGEKGVGRERLEQMARTALAGAAANPSSGNIGADETKRAPILSLSRVASKWVAAAAVVVAVAIGARLVLQRPDASEPVGLPFPSFGDDPEFVTNFEVIRDLPDLADGELLDVGDELLILQTLEGA